MSSAADIASHTFSSSDQLLFDANVWLDLYGPTSLRSRSASGYSGAFKRALVGKANLFVDVLVLSEFVNRWARIEHRISGVLPGDFKAYRRSTAFAPVAAAIVAACRKIFGCSKRVESGFSTLDPADLLHDLESKQSDFNDEILLRLCTQNSLTLVTHDSDFKGAAIPVLTSNSKLIGT